MASSPNGLDAASTGTSPKLEHAYLQVYAPSKDGSLSGPGAPTGKITFQFNPKELTVAKQAAWSREKSKGSSKSGPPQFTGAQPSKLTLEMFLDASAKPQDNSVVKTVEQLFECCVPTTASQDKAKASPPWVVFRWGSLTGFLAYIGSVSAKYTLFTSGGVPIRAVCTVTLEELAGDPPKQNPTSGGTAPRHVHRVLEGDTLAAISYREYGRASLWRALAQANDIDDPMRLPPGTSLLLPPLEEIAAAPGPKEVAGASR